MSHYKIGLAMDVRVIGPGRVSIGAVEWSISKYEELAKKLWSETTAPYAIISITRNGASHLVSPYTDKDEASDHYGTVTDIPGTAAYVAYFDRNVKSGEQALIDSAFYIAPEKEPPPAPKPMPQPMPQVAKQEGSLGLIIAVAAAGIGGLVAFSPKKRKV